jgi:hypothetical protein
MADVEPRGLQAMSNHPIEEATVGIYVGLLLALGQIGLGWFLAFRSPKMIGTPGSGKRSESILTRFHVIWGWMFLIGGCLCVAIFLVLVAVITIQSLRS